MNPKLNKIYYEDGSIKRRQWILNGKLYREDGPALIWYRKDGSIECEEWLIKGVPHREDGPSFIFYNIDGSIKEQEWWMNGKLLLKLDFDSLDMVKKMNAYPLFTVKEIARMKLDEDNHT